ncbi:MAG: DUF2852 domain-containing protein [Pseudomonadota bacterium]
MTDATYHESRPMPASRPSPRADTISIILYGIFAMPVSIVAIVNNTFFGIVLAAILGYIWLRLSGIETGTPMDDAVDALKPDADTPVKSSGNATFDAYREELLERLEKEQMAFEGFLDRLRSAKDKSEFDDFMEARALSARKISAD